MTEIYYFAYGSNMSLRRLAARISGISHVGTARLERHALVFHKVGWLDGSGKCGVVPAADSEVHGRLLRLPAAARERLDRIEGVGRGYEAGRLDVIVADGSVVPAHTYLPTRLDPSLRPFDWYLEHVLVGARESMLPADYVRRLAATLAVPDPDPARAETELEIYR